MEDKDSIFLVLLRPVKVITFLMNPYIACLIVLVLFLLIETTSFIKSQVQTGYIELIMESKIGN